MVPNPIYDAEDAGDIQHSRPAGLSISLPEVGTSNLLEAGALLLLLLLFPSKKKSIDPDSRRPRCIELYPVLPEELEEENPAEVKYELRCEPVTNMRLQVLQRPKTKQKEIIHIDD